MGSALLKTWLQNTNNIFVVIDPIQYKNINKNFGNKVKAFQKIDLIKNIKLFDIIIFAIKPQQATRVLESFKEFKFSKKTIFISIVAGKTIKFFNKYLNTPNQFIRVMPNMPAMINEGMTCMYANQYVVKKNIKIVNYLFLKVGKNLWLKKESDINKVTAISGSGPGYVFLFIDAFEKAAKQLNLNEEVIKGLINQTFLGSIKLLLEDNTKASVLAKNIAVKGGTTEAALNNFYAKDILHKTFVKVIQSAFFKAKELGK